MWVPAALGLVLHWLKLRSGQASALIEKQVRDSLFLRAAGFRNCELLCQTPGPDCRTGACCRTAPLPTPYSQLQHRQLPSMLSKLRPAAHRRSCLHRRGPQAAAARQPTPTAACRFDRAGGHLAGHPAGCSAGSSSQAWAHSRDLRPHHRRGPHAEAAPPHAPPAGGASRLLSGEAACTPPLSQVVTVFEPVSGLPHANGLSKCEVYLMQTV